MNEKDNHLLTVELSEEQNGNMLDGILPRRPTMRSASPCVRS